MNFNFKSLKKPYCKKSLKAQFFDNAISEKNLNICAGSKVFYEYLNAHLCSLPFYKANTSHKIYISYKQSLDFKRYRIDDIYYEYVYIMIL